MSTYAPADGAPETDSTGVKIRSELLRIATAGSVDDGKSTLIGRLLHDTKSIFEDQMEHVVETSERRGDGYVNLAIAAARLAEPLDGLELVFEDRLGIVEQPPDQRALAVINRAGSSKAK